MNANQIERIDDRPPKIFWLVLPLGIALAAFITANIVLLLFNLPELSILSLAASLGALVVGIPAWYQFIMLPRHATIRRGIAVGAIGSIIVHPVMWMLAYLLAKQTVFGTGDTSLMVWAILSLLYAGWITTPCGALTGVVLVSLQRCLTYVTQTGINRSAEALQQREMYQRDVDEWRRAKDTSEDQD